LFAGKNQRGEVATADHEALAVLLKLLLLVEGENVQQSFEVGGFIHRRISFYSKLIIVPALSTNELKTSEKRMETNGEAE
jgi:hypothetical protein